MDRRTLVKSIFAISSLSSVNALSFGASSDSPIKLLVGSPAGGPPDVAYRALAERLSAVLDRPIYIHNVPGVTLFRELRKAPADGSTIAGIFAAQATVAPHYQPGVDYDVAADFTPLGIWSSGPSLIVTTADSPYKHLRDVLAAWREKPGEVVVATQGVASPGHLYLAQLTQQLDLRVLAVPYKAGQAQLALLRGEAQLIVDGPAALLEHIRAGKMRALAVIGYPRRIEQLPDVPTLRETGLVGGGEGLEVETWMGLIAPGGMTSEVVDKLHGALSKVAQDATFRSDQSRRFYREVALSSPEAMRDRIRRESALWKRVVQRIGLENFR
jgi:tripartite-type tricarboxylate transporter receptor subunit TctC